MDVDTLESYWHAITVIEARESLLQMSIADYPQAKKTARQKFSRQVERAANKIDDPDAKELTMEELDARLRAILG